MAEPGNLESATNHKSSLSEATKGPHPAPEKLLLDISEVMATLGISRQSVYNLLNSGALPSLLIGQRRRKVSRRALEDFIRKQESRAA